MKPFDLLTAELNGTQLIEASAGTGKTYTISGIFLRLILEQDLTAEQVLVVTFTRAATEELKERIYSRLNDARRGLKGGPVDDPLIRHIVRTTADRQPAIQKLEAALADFDRAAIYTIHGFCQRLLVEHAFETGSLYDLELVADPSAMIREVADDFFRKTIYPAPPEPVSFLRNKKGCKGPEYFYRLSGKISRPGIEVIPLSITAELENLDLYRRLLDEVRELWRSSADLVLEMLRNADLDGRIYGKFDPAVSNSRRDMILTRLSNEMDELVFGKRTIFPPFEGIQKFAASTIREYAGKKNPPPEHALFDGCERLVKTASDLANQMEAYFLWLKAAFVRYFRNALELNKARRRVRFYDDLVVDVWTAINNPGQKSNRLVSTVQNRYRAALVDEFQDTDAIQYDLFRSFFSSPAGILFMIGDPKQSIYSFRGADIFTYLQAGSDAGTQSTLHHNWRSEPALLEALNTLFLSCKRPFLYPQITYQRARAAPQKTSVETGADNSAPLEIWYLPASGPRPVTKEQAEQTIAAATAAEIKALASSPSYHTGAGDVAVLVRTNRQARLIKSALAKTDIPAVLVRAGNVFDSGEAMEMERLLVGVANAPEERTLRAAVTTGIMGVSGGRMASVEIDPEWWEILRTRFINYRQIWKRNGFMPMFRALLTGERVRPRLLDSDEGQRRLTNVLHLAEILHQQESANDLTPMRLLKWFARQRNPQTERREEHELRIERDELAVKIVTIHRSKGLEYPIVFCPFCWEGLSGRREQEVFYHSTGNHRQRMLDLGSDDFEQHYKLFESETVAENLRLLYVAVTRACQKCYIVWGRINSAETSALAYIFHRPTELESDNVASQLRAAAGMRNDSEMLEVLQQLSADSKGRIKIRRLPITHRHGSTDVTPDNRKLNCRVFSGRIDRSWTIASYTALVSRRWKNANRPELDDLSIHIRSEQPVTGANPSPPADNGQNSIHHFPKGARAGIFFHSILQHLDFSNPDRSHLDDLVSAKLQQFDFDPGWHTVVSSSIRKALHILLSASDPDLSFACLNPEDRINEMEFTFPLNSITSRQLFIAFERHGGMAITTEFVTRLKTMSAIPDCGFMKGFIDLVFYYRDRYYIVDWKSNHLGETAGAYSPGNLQHIMSQEMYVLQYYLYTVAVIRYLKSRMPDFNYERDFGGVFYVFLRGIGAGQKSTHGVFFDRPGRELADELDRLLILG